MKQNLASKVFIFATVGVSVFPVSVEAAPKKDKNKKLNILYIMSDDHTSQGIGVYNSRLSILNPTPTIDALAKEGVIFENVFCNNSISTPSRASIMTGQYSHTNGVYTLDEKLAPEQQYLTNELKQLGYQTAIVGKWHLGCEPSSFDYYSVFTEAGEQGKYFNPLMASSENKKKPFPQNVQRYQGHSSDIVTDVALEWFKEKRNPNKPFFFMHHYKAPHDNFEYAPRYADYLENVEIPVPSTLLNRDGFGSVATRGVNNSLDGWLGTSISKRNVHRNYVEFYKTENTGTDEENTIAAYNEYIKSYLRCVKGVDDNLERLFTYLKEEGLWDNTVIIYTGDQGMMLGEHDLQDKRWMYEECLRMPYIMRVPKSKANGTRNEMLIQNVDFAPTILALAGAKKTPAYMQGEDFSEVFSGSQEIQGWRDAIYYRYWMHLIHHNVPAHFGIRTKDYKLIFFYGRHYNPERYGEKSMAWLGWDEAPLIVPTQASFELYDMKNDPEETTNLATNPEYKEILETLKMKLLETKHRLGDSDTSHPEIREVIKLNFAKQLKNPRY